MELENEMRCTALFETTNKRLIAIFKDTLNAQKSSKPSLSLPIIQGTNEAQSTFQSTLC